MTEPSQLAPAPVGARGKAKGKLGVAFGRRFFLLLLVGLVWIGPAWANPKYLLGLALWDALVLLLWAADLTRLPKPEEIEVRRVFHSTLQLREPAETTLEFTNRGKSTVLLRAQEEVPVGLRKEIPEVDVRIPAGGSQSATYPICPRQRGDMNFGNTFLRYQTAWHFFLSAKQHC